MSIIKKYSVYFFIVIFIITSLELLLKLYSNFYNVKFINDNRYSQIFKVYDQGKIFKSYKNFFYMKKI